MRQANGFAMGQYWKAKIGFVFGFLIDMFAFEMYVAGDECIDTATTKAPAFIGTNMVLYSGPVPGHVPLKNIAGVGIDIKASTALG